MEIFSALLAICAGNSPVPGEFLAQRPATRSFDVFFDLRVNKRLSKQSQGWWFETLSCTLWRQCNVISGQFADRLFIQSCELSAYTNPCIRIKWCVNSVLQTICLCWQMSYLCTLGVMIPLQIKYQVSIRTAFSNKLYVWYLSIQPVAKLWMELMDT